MLKRVLIFCMICLLLPVYTGASEEGTKVVQEDDKKQSRPRGKNPKNSAATVDDGCPHLYLPGYLKPWASVFLVVPPTQSVRRQVLH